MGIVRNIRNIGNCAYKPIKEQLQKIYRPKQYIRKYGRDEGLRIYNRIYSPGGQEEVAVNLPGYRHPIHIRKRTSDVRIFQHMFLKEEYDIALPFEVKTILDGGANAGYAAVYFANKFPGAKIVALEPEESNYELLLRNTAGYPNVICVKSAIWGSCAHLRISNPDDEKWAIKVEICDKSDPGSFQAFSIQDIMKDHEWERIDLLKLDIEGAEADVFKSGYETWLPLVGAMLVELHEKLAPGVGEILERALQKHDFDRDSVGENTICINNRTSYHQSKE